jgi:uridylate kinase
MNTVVISLGGSLIVPDIIDTKFLKNFKKIILNFIKKNNRIIIVCGGGKTCRNYVNSLKKITYASNEEFDKLGIQATKLNAELIRILFGKFAYKTIQPDFSKKNLKFKVLIGSGHVPGSSSDYDAIMWAKNYNAKTIVNMSNTNYVYTKDPRKYKDAKKIINTNWKQLQKIVGSKWVAGANLPFDPVATKYAHKFKQKVVFINGKKLKNFDNFLKGKKFIGTTVC